MDNSKVDVSSESGSISDGTLIIDDYNEHFTSKWNTKSKVMSKISDYDFYNDNYIDRLSPKTNTTNDISLNAKMTNTEYYEESSYDSDLTHKNSTGTLISLSSLQFSRKQNNTIDKKDTIDESCRFEKETLVINKMLEEINNSYEDDDDDDEVDSDINKILYIPSDTQRKLCLSPLQSKIKVNIGASQEEEEKNNVHELILDSMSYSAKKRYSKTTKKGINHKKCKSEGSYLAFKMKNKNNINNDNLSKLQRHHHNTTNKNQKENEEEFRESSTFENHQHSNASENELGILRSHSLKDCPPIPPRGISIIHMKNRMRKNVKSEILAKKNKESSEKNNFFRTLPLNKSSYNTDFNTLLKRRYRENKIKILYRTKYYMQTLDDTDYESYDKALFDDQLFINVENNETDCSKEISEKESSNETENFLTNPLDLLSKRKRNPNIISPLYQQLVDRIQKNKKEREKMEKELKRQEKEKNMLSSPDFSFKNSKEHEKNSKSQNKLHRYAIADFNNILSSLKNKTFQSSKNNISEGIKSELDTNSNNNEYDVNQSTSSNSRNLKKCKSCSNISSLSNSNSVLSSTSASSNKKYHSNQSTYMNHKSDSVSLKSSVSNYAQPTDYYKQYNADNGDSDIHRKPSYHRHFYPYQTPTYDDYCHSSSKSSLLLGCVNSSNTSLNSNCPSEVHSFDSTITATDLTYKGCLGKDFTSYYNYNKTYNLPYTSGIDVLNYY